MTRDRYRYFRIEANEIAPELARGTIALERAADPAIRAAVLRHAHTLKGAARVVKQIAIADACHAIETALGAHPDTEPLDRATAEAMLALVDRIAALVEELDAPPEVTPPSVAAEAIARPPAEPAATREEEEDVQVLGRAVRATTTTLAAHRDRLSALERAERLAQKLTGPLAEELRDLLVVTRRDLTTSTDTLERELKEVRDTSERLRLVSVKTTFGALERVVRDAALTLGKDANLVTSGGDVRMEAGPLVVIQRALVQLVKNAVAHGIESPDARARAGKRSRGRVEVSVSLDAGMVTFVCRDDGAGVDGEAVRRAAIERGILASDEDVSDADALLALLVRGGMTTEASLSSVAGRGIGLDIVREVVANAGGSISLETTRGIGASFTLKVPASLTAFDALVVETAGAIVALPLTAVRKAMRCAPDDIERTDDCATIAGDDRRIPLIRLSRAIGLDDAAGFSRATTVVILESRGAVAAVAVDRLLGREHVITRKLPRLAPAHRVVLGAMHDASGRLRLVLDADVIVATHARYAEQSAPAPIVHAPILVVDDSLTTRMLEQAILESAGYTVELAASAEEAMDKARHQKYALFLVDVEMPKMDGFTFVSETRKDAALRRVPAILVSSRGAEEDFQRAADAGAAAYIVKGAFDQKRLLDEIRKLL